MAAPSYATLPTLKLALQIKPGDTTRDELLNIALGAAARAIYRKTGRRRFDRDLVPTTRTIPTAGRVVWDRAWRSYRFMVPDIATSVGLTLTAPGWSYVVTPIAPDDPGDPITGLLAAAWPDQVTITAAFGWPEVPDDIIQAHLLQAMRLYRRKDSPEGIAGSAEWGLVRVPRLDPDVESLIEDYCYPAVA